MKTSTTLFTCILLLISSLSLAQRDGESMTYRVVSKDVNTYRGSIHLRVPMTLNSYNGIGLNAGAQAEYRLPVLPLTIRGNFEVEIGGLGESDAIGEDGGRFREIDAGVMYPLIGGRRKNGKVKMTLESYSSMTHHYEKFIYTEGEIKNDFLARAGLFHWGARQFRASGFSAGVAFRKLQHSEVEFEKWPDYTYSTFKQVLIYADALIFPVQTVTSNEFRVTKDPASIGFRIGMMVEWHASNSFYTEIGVRPAPNNMAIGFINFGYTFGWGLK